MDSALAKTDYARDEVKVILLAGLRGCGNSLCGRALQQLLSCGYLDLDEEGEIGEKNSESFIRTV